VAQICGGGGQGLPALPQRSTDAGAQSSAATLQQVESGIHLYGHMGGMP